MAAESAGIRKVQSGCILVSYEENEFSVFTCMHVDISAVPSLLFILRCLCLKENAKRCVMRSWASMKKKKKSLAVVSVYS